MSKIEIEIIGIPELGKNMNKYSEDVKRKLDDAIQNGALEIMDVAKILVPVDTGRLKMSIHYQKTGEAAAQVGTNVEYAAAQEFGTSKMRGQPYLRPAVEGSTPRIIENIKATLRNAKP